MTPHSLFPSPGTGEGDSAKPSGVRAVTAASENTPPQALTAWYAIAAAHDPATAPARLDALIAEDAIFESPVVHRPQPGRALGVGYLTGAMHVLGGPAFRYTGEWLNADGAVLEFETEVDGIAINGVDILRFTPDGAQIAHFKVMIRPLKAIELVHRLMGQALAKTSAH